MAIVWTFSAACGAPQKTGERLGDVLLCGAEKNSRKSQGLRAPHTAGERSGGAKIDGRGNAKGKAKKTPRPRSECCLREPQTDAVPDAEATKKIRQVRGFGACSRRPGPKARHPLHRTKQHQHKHKRRPWTFSACFTGIVPNSTIPACMGRRTDQKNWGTFGVCSRESCPKARYPLHRTAGKPREKHWGVMSVPPDTAQRPR